MCVRTSSVSTAADKPFRSSRWVRGAGLKIIVRIRLKYHADHSSSSPVASSTMPTVSWPATMCVEPLLPDVATHGDWATYASTLTGLS